MRRLLALMLPGRREVGLQTILTTVPVLVVLPMALFCAVLLYTLHVRNEHDVQRDLVQANQALGVSVQRELDGYVRMLQVMANSQPFRVGVVGIDRFDGMWRHAMRSEWGWQALMLVDRSERHWVRDAQGPVRNVDAPMSAHHRRVFDTGQPVVSDLHESVLTGEACILVSVPVFRDGEVVFVLSARVDPEHLARILAEQKTQYASVAVLVDRSMRIVAKSQDMGKLLGKTPSDDIVGKLRSAPGGVAHAQTLQGMPVLGAWTSLPGGWVLWLAMPTEAYAAPLRSTSLRFAAAGLLSLLLGVALAVTIARMLSRAVSTMAHDAPRLLEGAAPAHRPSGVRQLDALYRALEQAATRLASAIRERACALEAERAARAQAEQASRAKDEFLAMLSHELRNPLAPLTNAHRFLGRTEQLTERGHATLQMAQRQAGQMTRLVDDLMEVSRITQGRIALKPAEVDVAELVAQSVAAAAVACPDRGRPPRVTVCTDAGHIVADAARITQVLENLLNNAIKYTRADDDICVEVVGRDQEVEIRVCDRGVGIGPEDLPRVFDLFMQADVTLDRSRGGLGIGLSLVRKLVQMHGGTIDAASPGKGHGSVFTVRLPRCGAMPAAEPQAPDSIERAASALA